MPTGVLWRSLRTRDDFIFALSNAAKGHRGSVCERLSLSKAYCVFLMHKKMELSLQFFLLMSYTTLYQERRALYDKYEFQYSR